MNNSTFNANLNLKQVPAQLTVHGSIMTYRADDVISLKPAISQGIIASTLILDLKIKPGSGSMKGTAKPFTYPQNDELAATYSKVTIRFENGEEETQDVKIWG